MGPAWDLTDRPQTATKSWGFDATLEWLEGASRVSLTDQTGGPIANLLVPDAVGMWFFTICSSVSTVETKAPRTEPMAGNKAKERWTRE